MGDSKLKCVDDVRNELFSMQDLQYREFHKKLIPNVDENAIIGVRTPQLRKFAKDFSNTEYVDVFIKNLPHQYYEENNLHGFLIEQIKDFDQCIEALDLFLPYVDNWATCDMMRPKVFKKNKPQLLIKIKDWLKSDSIYVVRFAIEMLMAFFLDEDFDESYPELVSRVKSDEYYINMMIAWYFATALAKQYDAVLPYIETHRLSDWVHNKSIQKAVESFRVSASQKDFLRTLRAK